MFRPIIGITADRSDEAHNIESYFLVRRNYCSAISSAGGVPVILPYDADALDDYIDLMDGLLITGGMFDIDPAEYGMPIKHPDKVVIKHDRTNFERALLRRALADDLPVLGICGGMQLLAVELGARIFQDLPSDISTDIEHKQLKPCSLGTHRVKIDSGTLLHRVLKTDSLTVNSMHHQAVMGGNAAVRIGATADDEVVEAIEAVERAFCIGVQWHPEYLVNSSEGNLFTGLVSAAAEAAAKKALYLDIQRNKPE